MKVKLTGFEISNIIAALRSDEMANLKSLRLGFKTSLLLKPLTEASDALAKQFEMPEEVRELIASYVKDKNESEKENVSFKEIHDFAKGKELKAKVKEFEKIYNNRENIYSIEDEYELNVFKLSDFPEDTPVSIIVSLGKIIEE